MKQLLKMLTKYEGKKSQVSYANAKEAMNVLAAILMAEEAANGATNTPMHDELSSLCGAALAKIQHKFPSGVTFEDAMAYLIKPLKKKKKAPAKIQKNKSKIKSKKKK
jgi:hypothetical protein